MKSTWIKIVVHLASKPSGPAPEEIAIKWTEAFEDRFRVSHLYFANYRSQYGSHFEISALTGADPGKIRTFFKRCISVTGVDVQSRDDGSLAHAAAYQMLKLLPPRGEKLRIDAALGDVLHWTMNMYGYDYLDEVWFCNQHAAFVLGHLINSSNPSAVEEKASPTQRPKSTTTNPPK